MEKEGGMEMRDSRHNSVEMHLLKLMRRERYWTMLTAMY